MLDVGLLLLALEDFLPVVLSAAAYIVLARVCSRLDHSAGRRVFAGVALIATGGITKPIYKSILAVAGEDAAPAVLDELLFWFLAPGFVLLASGLADASRVDRAVPTRPATPWLLTAAAVPLLGLAALAARSGAWFPLLLAVATIGNTYVIGVLVAWARRRGETLAAGLFALSLFLVFGLAWAAAALDQTLAVQWGEQLTSTANQALVLVASLRLRTKVSAASAQI